MTETREQERARRQREERRQEERRQATRHEMENRAETARKAVLTVVKK